MVELIEQIVDIILFSLVIWVLSKLFKLENQKYKFALFIALILGAFEFIVINSYHLIFKAIMPLMLSVALLFFIYILLVVLIRYFYKIRWSKSFLISLVGFVIQLIVASIFLLSFGLV